MIRKITLTYLIKVVPFNKSIINVVKEFHYQSNRSIRPRIYPLRIELCMMSCYICLIKVREQ